MTELEYNLKAWLDWGLLRIGAWTDVQAPTSPGVYGGNFAKLRLIDEPSFSAGQVWESARKDWVWETGVDYVDQYGDTKNPIEVAATVSVNGSATVYSWIDYPLGRVYFSSPISTSATVLVSYSFRNIQTYIASTIDWWNELQFRSFRPDDSHFTQTGTGNWSVGGQHRIQMPCIVIEAVPRTISKAYQIGDGSYWVYQDVVCTVISENANMRNKITDILRGQYDAQIWLMNSNEVAIAEGFPLDYRGMLVDSTATYPNLTDANTGYRWALCRFANTSVSDMETLNSKLYISKVRLTCEVALNP